MTILLTGGSGFVGFKIAQTLAKSDVKLVLGVRSGFYPISHQWLEGQVRTVGDIDANTNWKSCLERVDTVVHCAAVSNVGQRATYQDLSALRAINVDGTLNLASQATSAGVKRFVFLSSIKVNGEFTKPNIPFTPEDPALPSDVYGASKFEAEEGLKKICQRAGMEFVIIRPPLVYGPNAKGNFARLVKLVKTGIPLPLAEINNQRSLIALDNLVDLVITTITNPRAANEVFLASDGHDLSTSDLLQGLAQAMGKPSRLFPCSPKILANAAKCLGKIDLFDRLLGSLQADISKTKRLLKWAPPVTVEEGLRRCFSEL